MKMPKQKRKLKMPKAKGFGKPVTPHLPMAKVSYHKSKTSGKTHFGPQLRGPKGAGQYGTHPFEKLLRIPT
jgi:hypothetical protein